MARVLMITHCMYCPDGVLRRVEREKQNRYHCKLVKDKDGNPTRSMSSDFNQELPHWCPLPTLIEKVIDRLG